MSNDDKIEQLKPFTEREKEIFKVGVEFGIDELKKRINGKIVKSSWFEIGYEES